MYLRVMLFPSPLPQPRRYLKTSFTLFFVAKMLSFLSSRLWFLILTAACVLVRLM